MKGLLSIYAPANRTRLLIASGLLIIAIAVVDWLTKPYISLSFPYLFPIMIVGGFLSRTQTVALRWYAEVSRRPSVIFLQTTLSSGLCSVRRVLLALGFSFRSSCETGKSP
jgi:hypothetical protein